MGERTLAFQALARIEKLMLSAYDRRHFAILHQRLAAHSRPQPLILSLGGNLPDSIGLWIERAELAVGLGEREQALEGLERVMEMSPSADQRTRVAVLYRKLREHGRALALMKQLSELRPHDVELWIEQAELAVEMGERAQALLALTRFELLKPSAADRRRGVALYIQLKEYPKAAVELEALARSEPENSDLGIAQAELAVTMGERKRALRELARVEALKPSAEGRLRVAHSYQNLKEYDRAVAVLDTLIVQRPSAAELYSDRGLCRHLKGQTGAAAADLDHAIELDADFFPAYLTLGAIRTAQGRNAEALKLYDRALLRPSLAKDASLRELVRKSRQETLSRLRSSAP